ncbi:MAG: hypothetical protein COV72_04295 [Candidatus Omnitrophica bacterium CG11_big_fil_rev_8_21_14_0_20_42_13]|uniref:Tyrosine kinase G-rich domain-containing protein n=1 Tax=Candidatus Ghiorseimicrobium undicola TaxID=1974746 RepID=A0A2H0LXV1_9BACT|nr:MAG: hypothetical protein COV72_04295 [Candidatus Omnitrophica bacterium CG11_big_fil_rev_8_21_14_0_20_42_13]
MENSETVKNLMPIDYLKILFRRKWLLIAAVYIGLIGGIIASYLLPKSYESYTVILVEEGKIINPIISSLAVSTTMTQRMQTIQEQMLSWNSLTQLVKQLKLDANAKSQYEYEQLILSIRRNIRVHLGGKNVIKISFADKDPAKAQAIVKTITEIFINQNITMQNQETDDAINFINDQLQVYRKKIKEGEISAMKQELDKLLIDATEKHPVVQDLKLKIAQAEEELASGNFDLNETDTATGPKGKKLKEELITLRDSIDLDNLNADIHSAGTVNDAMYKMLLVDKIDNVLKQDAKIDESIYNKLLERLETAKITKRLDASVQGTRYTVLDPPRLPIKPTKPNKILVIFMGIFLGAACGLGAIFFMEFTDTSFIGIDEAKTHLTLPVLGGISRITTIEDITKEKNTLKKRVALLLIGGIALVIAIVIYSAINK